MSESEQQVWRIVDATEAMREVAATVARTEEMHAHESRARRVALPIYRAVDLAHVEGCAMAANRIDLAIRALPLPGDATPGDEVTP